MGKPGAASDALDLRGRLALSIPEAAKALGVSERHLRSVLPDLPHFRLGDRVLLPIDALRDELRSRAKAEKSRTDGIARDILHDLDISLDNS